jgi:lipopolysaccharide/colanic/teichoic acid biosynthesis glycosyltransferase
MHSSTFSSEEPHKALAPRQSIWARRRLDLLLPQAFVLVLVAALLLAIASFVTLSPAGEIALRTAWLCFGSAVLAALILDYFAKTTLFIDGTAGITASGISFTACLLLMASLHGGYTRSLFAASAVFWVLLQFALIWRALRLREVRFAAYDEAARTLMLDALTHRSAAMQHLRLSVLPHSGAQVDVSADGVVFSRLPEAGSAEERELIALRLAGARIYSAAFAYELVSGRVALQSAQHGFVDDFSRHPIYSVVKRLLDISGALVVGICSLPVLLLAIIAVRLDSPGAALFKQSRYGRGGKRFTIFKLRTMAVSHALHGNATEANDARITRIGAFLRKTRIDELPQLWNVISGDMSLIGPRPEWEVTAQDLSVHIPQFDMRLFIRPGITGWAQVHQGHVTSHEDVRTKLEFDLFYIRHMSLLLDLTIGWRTLKTIITSAGAK